MTLVDRKGGLLPPAQIDPQRWPDVAVTPRARLRATVAKRLFRRAAEKIPLRVVEGGGRFYGGGRSSDPVLTVLRPASFFRRLGATGTIGFGEAYMAGDWTTDDLAGVLSAFAANMRELVPASLRRLRHNVLHRQPPTDDNTVDGAQRNIRHHYDLSNDLFKTFLDETMTYSSAVFSGDPYDAEDQLAEAQRRKIDRLLDSANVGRGSRVLEIGTGWGELAIRAASRGADVTTLTLSEEQAKLARERIAAAGVSDRVHVLLQDYRRTEGEFDAVVSVEMIEAVGANHWHEYFTTIDRVLTPGGRVGLQAILQDHDTMSETRDTYTWIRKYIFPGGQLPSAEAIERTIGDHTSLRVADRYFFGRHYAETLRRWRARFEERAAEVARLGFDEPFRRMWSFYLAYCEAGFRTGYLDVAQFTLTKPHRLAPAHQ